MNIYESGIAGFSINSGITPSVFPSVEGHITAPGLSGTSLFF